MKKAISVLLILLISTAVFAGGGQQAAPAATTQPIVLRLAETHSADYPTNLGNLEFARLVNERTNGRIQIQVFPGAQLGEERAVIEQVQFGAIDFTRVSISPLSAFSRNFDALQMPFLYRNADHMWAVLNGPIGDEFLASLTPAGFVGLGWYDSGARSFYNSVRPVRRVADLAGLRIRVQESELMVGLVRALGAVATPMPFGEVYSALQTGVIDGAENNWPSYYSTSHFEVARYFIVNEHTRVPEIIIASKMSMDRLSAADQAIIKQAARDSQMFQRQKWAEFEAIAQAAIRANGNDIFILQDNSEFQAAMAPLYASRPADIQALIARIRAVR